MRPTPSSLSNFGLTVAFFRVGADVAEAGNGPGSYDVHGNIWHLNCCNPEDKYGNGGWAIFAAIFGWSNDGSVGTVLGYIFYWIAVVLALVVMQINEVGVNVEVWLLRR